MAYNLLLSYDRDTEKVGLELSENINGTRAFLLPSISQEDVDNLGELECEHKLFIDCVGSFTLVVKIGPIMSIGEKDIIPVPFHVFNECLKIGSSSYFESYSFKCISSLLKSDKKCLGMGPIPTDRVNLDKLPEAAWCILDVADKILKGKSVVNAAPRLVVDSPDRKRRNVTDIAPDAKKPALGDAPDASGHPFSTFDPEYPML
jgi:hypothetical protein